MSFIAFLGINSPHNWAYKGPKKDDTPLYKEFTLIMVESLHMQHPNEPVHFYAVNFPDDFKQQLLQLNPSIVFTERKEDFSAYSQQRYKGWLMVIIPTMLLKQIFWLGFLKSKPRDFLLGMITTGMRKNVVGELDKQFMKH